MNIRALRLAPFLVVLIVGCGEQGGAIVPPVDPNMKVGTPPNTEFKSKKKVGDAIRKPMPVAE